MLLAVFPQVARAQKVLVFDDSVHQSALGAANGVFPGKVTTATHATFDGLLAAQQWDIVLVNCSGTKPASWLGLAFHILGGGRAAIAHGDFDDTSYPGTPELLAVCEVSLSGPLSWSGTTLFDADTTNAFFQVPMPLSDWHSHHGDDGATFHLLGDGISVAHVGQPAEPVMVLGNFGRTMIMPVMDEAGDAWVLSSSLVTHWVNVLNVIWNTGSCLHYHGSLGTNDGGFHCVFSPQAGYPWRARIDPIPSVGTVTLATVVMVGSGPTNGTLSRGYELLTLPPFAFDIGFQSHQVWVPPGLTGSAFTVQAMRVEMDRDGKLTYVLLNSLNLVVG